MPKRAAKKTKKSMSKAGAIRDYKAAKPDSKPKEIAEYLNSQGFDLTAQYVSMILSNDRRKNGTARTRTATARVKSTGRKPGNLSIDDVLVAKSFVDQVGGIEAAQAAVEAFAKISGKL